VLVSVACKKADVALPEIDMSEEPTVSAEIPADVVAAPMDASAVDIDEAVAEKMQKKMDSKDPTNKKPQSKGSPIHQDSAPASKGEQLQRLTQPPEKTLSMLELKKGAKYSDFDAVVEPYGLKGNLVDGLPQEIVVRVSSWNAQTSGATKILDMTGRNASMRILAPAEQAKKLLKGGTYQVVVRIIAEGEIGILAIQSIR